MEIINVFGPTLTHNCTLLALMLLSLQTHLPALTLSPVQIAKEDIDDATDDDDTETNDDYQAEVYTQTEKPDYSQSIQQTVANAAINEDNSEQLDDIIPTTVSYPDVSENEVVTEATLSEVLDEIFEDASLGDQQRQESV